MLTADSRFDLIVIGGGINGAAIAREAALTGTSVLLLERDDFCSGTSAASTRLIHGGLRYLEYAEFGLVRESLLERERLLATAPHLVEPLEILLPLTRASRRGPLTIRLGMWLYDLLSTGKSLPGHRSLNPDELLEELPGLEPSGLRGGAAYHDAQVRYPERLVLENALDAEANGATLAPHTAATEIVVEAGKLIGVAWESAGERGLARAPVVVNAAGPWVDQVLGDLGTRRLIGGTRGSHLIARRFAGAPPKAIYAEAGSDGRPFFIIPWNGLYLIGTTDERFEGDPGDAQMTAGEYDYLITETQRLFPAASDLPERVCYTCSGIRPLPSKKGGSTGAITRRHLIRRHRGVSGLYSIIGGKLTTHRALAVDCMKAIRRHLGHAVSSRTAERPLPGALPGQEREALLLDLERSFGAVTAKRLWHTYGAGSRRLLEMVADNRELEQRAGPDTDLIVGELLIGLDHEHALSLEDLMMRRTMLGLDAGLGSSVAPLAADWLVRLGFWDKHKAAEEVTAYRASLRRFAVPSSDRA